MSHEIVTLVKTNLKGKNDEFLVKWQSELKAASEIDGSMQPNIEQ